MAQVSFPLTLTQDDEEIPSGRDGEINCSRDSNGDLGRKNEVAEVFGGDEVTEVLGDEETEQEPPMQDLSLQGWSSKILGQGFYG